MRARCVWLFLGVLLTPSVAQPFTLVCLGDSNTTNHSPDGSPWPIKSWCEILAERYPEWTVYNLAVASTTVVPRSSLDAPGQLVNALFSYSPIDVVIAAFGTNDVAHPYAPETIVAAYVRLAATATAAGAVLLPALTPRRWYPERYSREIRRANGLLQREFGRRAVVPFDRHVRRIDLPDGVHFSVDGQMRRADVAARALILAGW